MKNGMRLSRNQKIKTMLLRVSARIDRMCHVANAIAPPDYLSSQYGSGSYFEVGLHFFRILLDHCGLQRNSDVLEVGCGIGRMAMPLTAFLAPPGRYEGFDIMPVGIEYCSQRITPKFPGFRFQRADVFNSYYNPEGRAKVEEYTFPYADRSFDVVFSTSVFTHLPPPGVARYVRETARVLKPGGVCLHTCFLLNEETLAGLREGRDAYGIRHQLDGFMTNNLQNVEDAIAIPQGAVLSSYETAGFEPPRVSPGNWAGRAGETLSHQDIVVARRSR